MSRWVPRDRLAMFFAAVLEGASRGKRTGLFWSMWRPDRFGRQLRAWQKVRDARLLPDSAAMFLIDIAADAIAEPRVRALPEHRAMDERRRAIERDAGIPEDSDPDDWDDWCHRAPREYQECWDAMERIEVRQRAAVLCEFGEIELADMLERRPRQYGRQRERGRLFFLPP